MSRSQDAKKWRIGLFSLRLAYGGGGGGGSQARGRLGRVRGGFSANFNGKFLHLGKKNMQNR